MILVTGGPGLSGSEKLLRLLSQAGTPARAFVRNPNKAQKLPGIAWVVGDLARPETLVGLRNSVPHAHPLSLGSSRANSSFERVVSTTARGREVKYDECRSVTRRAL